MYYICVQHLEVHLRRVEIKTMKMKVCIICDASFSYHKLSSLRVRWDEVEDSQIHTDTGYHGTALREIHFVM